MGCRHMLSRVRMSFMLHHLCEAVADLMPRAARSTAGHVLVMCSYEMSRKQSAHFSQRSGRKLK